MKDLSFHSFILNVPIDTHFCSYKIAKTISNNKAHLSNQRKIISNLWHWWNIRSTISTSHTFWNTFKDSSHNNSLSLSFHKVPSPEILSPRHSEVNIFLWKCNLFYQIILSFRFRLQVSFGSTSPALSDRNEFPLFYRTVAPDSSHNPARIAFIRRFGWDTVTTFSQNEEIHSLAVNDLVTELENANISCAATITFGETDFKNQLLMLRVNIIYLRQNEAPFSFRHYVLYTQIVGWFYLNAAYDRTLYSCSDVC